MTQVYRVKMWPFGAPWNYRSEVTHDPESTKDALRNWWHCNGQDNITTETHPLRCFECGEPITNRYDFSISREGDIHHACIPAWRKRNGWVPA